VEEGEWGGGGGGGAKEFFGNLYFGTRFSVIWTNRDRFLVIWTKWDEVFGNLD
jgi:hypothetical protein